jgi:lysophospholipase L1-like esterase
MMVRMNLPSQAPLVFGLGVLLGAGCGAGDRLGVCCAGDSLIRPTPVYLREIAAAAGERLEIVEWAQGGLTADTYRSFFEERMAAGAANRCDAVLLQLGTNDAVPILEGRETAEEFRRRLAGIVAGFRAFPGIRRPHPEILVATVPRFCESPESAAKNGIVESVLNPAIRDVAAAAGAAVVDNHAVLLNRPSWYDPDCVHPNGDGERALAESWWRAVKTHLEKRHVDQ